LDPSLLKKIPLFAEVPDDALGKIAPFAQSKEFAKDNVVVREGGFSNHFYAIQEGKARVERAGKELAELGPGDVFGEQGLLEKTERSASVVAATHLRVIEIEHWELSRMRKSMPDVVEQLRQKVEERQG
jgi:CRP/FNR family transcriptional regulator, cyclic AMP receptor protein